MLQLTRKNAIDMFDIKNRPSNSFDNLFVISNLGQLHHVQGLIEKFNFHKNCLLVVYTESNYHVPQLIHDDYSKVFECVIFLELPKSPNSYSIKKILKIKNSYNQLLLHITTKNIFLNSFQYHYTLLGNLALKKRIKIFLVEEGLGTYRLGVSGTEEKIHPPKLDTIKKISQKTLGKSEIFKKSYRFCKEMVIFVNESRAFAKQVINHEDTQKFIVSKYPNKIIRSFTKPLAGFEETYTTFPELSKKIFGAKNHVFYSAYEKYNHEQADYARQIIDKYNITSKDFIYLSQRYQIDTQEYLNILYPIFIKMIGLSDSKIYVKLHPKTEMADTLKGFLVMESKMGGRLVVIRESGFLIEELIRQSQIKGVIGITSSALVYSSIVSPSTKVYSVVEILLAKLNKANKANTKGINMIKEHAKIIRQFDKIQFLN